MPELEFIVDCDSTSHGELNTEWGNPDKLGTHRLIVSPCEQCLEEAREEGRKEAAE